VEELLEGNAEAESPGPAGERTPLPCG
jgi:hypothetical protein